MDRVTLTLSDGTEWPGLSANGLTEAEGEVVFTTASCGYPQSITDPSYNGQVLVFAFPLVGNYGVDEDRLESRRPWVKAVLAACLTGESRLGPRLEDWLARWGVPAVTGVDTRSLIRHLREKGTAMGRLSNLPRLPEKTDLPRDLAIEASVSELVIHNEGSGGPRIALLDYGV
ncbi:MAG: carbamoyl-phosphate synthase (glutamine-hydrolyzing) small subunit, partial [Synergistaceae bacterium]|nr:carbamoyl-phosphate synthase (glutamine-hydrolyzing) small subunit [Synergistaceae bacterium]